MYNICNQIVWCMLSKGLYECWRFFSIAVEVAGGVDGMEVVEANTKGSKGSLSDTSSEVGDVVRIE